MVNSSRDGGVYRHKRRRDSKAIVSKTRVLRRLSQQPPPSDIRLSETSADTPVYSTAVVWRRFSYEDETDSSSKNEARFESGNHTYARDIQRSQQCLLKFFRTLAEQRNWRRSWRSGPLYPEVRCRSLKLPSPLSPLHPTTAHHVERSIPSLRLQWRPSFPDNYPEPSQKGSHTHTISKGLRLLQLREWLLPGSQPLM